MVNNPTPQSDPTEKPFALRATIYTIGFLLIVLGVIPSLFLMAEEVARGKFLGFWASASAFWHGFRDLVGMSFFATGLIAYLVCSAWLVYHGRGPHVEFDAPKVFVANGPYRWVRNPVVITLLFIVLGEALYFASWGIFLFTVFGIVFAHYQATKIEEPRLLKRFGDSYADYMRRVPRWLPRPPSDG